MIFYIKMKIRLYLSTFLFLFVAFGTVVAQKKYFTNPILMGFYPDPSVCKANGKYYLINSTFAYYPGIPVFESPDLVNWKQIGNVMTRPEQMQLDGFGVSRGLFAPAISYHEGIFYVVCTLVDGAGNFVVTSESPEGPYSNPVWLPELNGIDPSLFFDDDGKSFIVYNSVAPLDSPLYEGHRTIRMYEFDHKSLQVIGDEILLINGGSDIDKKPVWIEGPHMYKINNYYYLIAAEGVTSDNHSEVVFRSKSIKGPFISYDQNPILTQRHLDPNREFPVTSTGHADIIETENGNWWAVFLGCRPYAPYTEGLYNTGRETFLAPVEWVDDWPVINPSYDEIQSRYPKPGLKSENVNNIPLSGNFTYKDDFSDSLLSLNWTFLRTVNEKWYDLKSDTGILELMLRPETCSEKVNPSFIGHRQQHLKNSSTVSLSFDAKSENEKAGLLIFQNETHYYYLCKSIENQKSVVQLFRSGDNSVKGNFMDLLASANLNQNDSGDYLQLKIEANETTYSFYYSGNDGQWIPLKENVDAAFLSTKVAGGFVGGFYAMYATSLGQPSNNSVFFDWFEYIGNDDFYK